MNKTVALLIIAMMTTIAIASANISNNQELKTQVENYSGNHAELQAALEQSCLNPIVPPAPCKTVYRWGRWVTLCSYYTPTITAYMLATSDYSDGTHRASCYVKVNGRPYRTHSIVYDTDPFVVLEAYVGMYESLLSPYLNNIEFPDLQ